MWRVRFADRTGAVGVPASEAAEETAVEVEWDEAVGWLWPRHDIHRLKAPARNSADGLAWWRVIGPETRCPLRWRPELKLVSVYVLSSLTFAASGALALAAGRVDRREASLLFLVGITSFQADVTYLGIRHHWRTADTIVALALVLAYVGRAAHRVVAHGELARALAFGPFFWAIRAFGASQRSATFRERRDHHIRWHFGLQAALLLLVFDASELARGWW